MENYEIDWTNGNAVNKNGRDYYKEESKGN
jgi:hypothetical protein